MLTEIWKGIYALTIEQNLKSALIMGALSILMAFFSFKTRRKTAFVVISNYIIYGLIALILFAYAIANAIAGLQKTQNGIYIVIVIVIALFLLTVIALMLRKKIVSIDYTPVVNEYEEKEERKNKYMENSQELLSEAYVRKNKYNAEDLEGME